MSNPHVNRNMIAHTKEGRVVTPLPSNRKTDPVHDAMMELYDYPYYEMEGVMPVGPTGYLDQCSDIIEPIMKGFDEYGRPFIAVRVEEVDYLEDGPTVWVYHKRYAEGLGPWVCAGGRPGLVTTTEVEDLICMLGGGTTESGYRINWS